MAVAVIGYWLYVWKTVNAGVSRSIELPTHSLRVSIHNATGQPGAEKKLVQQLEGYQSPELSLSVVAVGENPTVSESFIIAREIDETGSRILAAKLAIPEDRILKRDLDFNTEHLSATIVLGKDYKRIGLKSEEEKTR